VGSHSSRATARGRGGGGSGGSGECVGVGGGSTQRAGGPEQGGAVVASRAPAPGWGRDPSVVVNVVVVVVGVAATAFAV
jgi:hypothetical protein